MSNSFETTGRVHVISDTQQVSDTFKKREFVLEIQDGNYPQYVKFQMTQDKTILLDNYQIGQEVKVLFNLRGREYVRKNDGSKDYWLNLEAWRIEAASSGVGASAEGTDYSQISPASASGGAQDFDDVPF